jgi:hypothetical protein
VKPVDHVLAAGATARLARLITKDTLLDEPRLRFLRRMDATGHPKLAELAVCQWCISVWIGFAVAILGRRGGRLFRVVTAALTYSLAAGVIGELGTERD